RHLRRDGVEVARSGRAAGEGRCVRRSHRPAHAATARRRGDRGHREEDQQAAGRARGHAHRRARGGDRGAHQRAGVRGARAPEGTLSKGLKKLGDEVKRDEPLFEISTDKVDAEIPAPAAGKLVEIKVQEGQTVPVQTLVAVLETDKGAAVTAVTAASAAAPAAQKAEPPLSAPVRPSPPPSVPVSPPPPPESGDATRHPGGP